MTCCDMVGHGKFDAKPRILKTIVLTPSKPQKLNSLRTHKGSQDDFGPRRILKEKRWKGGEQLLKAFTGFRDSGSRVLGFTVSGFRG